MPRDAAAPTTRRALLGAGMGALAATAAGALSPAAAGATSPPVLLGASNDAAATTTVRDTSASASAVAIVGRVSHAAGSAAGAGLKGIDDGADGTGVAGVANAGAAARGVYGQSASGRGVEGAASSGIGAFGHSASGRGVQGNSATGTGVYGVTSSGWGVQGEGPAGGAYGHSAGGDGVLGRTASAGAAAAGVRGEAAAAGGAGVRGAGSGAGGYGVHGSAPEADGYGVFGEGFAGVLGSGRVYGVAGSAPGAGVSGGSATGDGVQGHTASGAASGVYGWNDSTTDPAIGVAGRSYAFKGIGVYGDSVDTGYGVWGNDDAPGGFGVVGDSAGNGGHGVYGSATGTNGVAVSGWAWAVPGGYAGYFTGDVNVAGNLTSPIATLLLDHPDAPSSRWYRQSLVGSFERVSVIGGNAVTGADGTVTVTVPALFARYHGDVRYLLTPLGHATDLRVGKKLDARGRFTIAADQAALEVSWQLTGVRSDPSALATPLTVESRKPARYRGRYLEPKVYGKTGAHGLLAPPTRPRGLRPRKPLPRPAARGEARD